MSKQARAGNLDSLTAVVEFEVPRRNNLNSSDSLGFANSIPLLTTPCDGTARAVGGCLGMEVREDRSCATGTMGRSRVTGATALTSVTSLSDLGHVTSVTSSSNSDLGHVTSVTSSASNDLGQSERRVQSGGKCETYIYDCTVFRKSLLYDRLFKTSLIVLR